MTEYHVSSAAQLPHPQQEIINRIVQSDCDELVHQISIPSMGQYAYNFKLCCNPLVTGVYGDMLQVDTVHNHVDTIHLCVNDLHHEISCIRLPVHISSLPAKQLSAVAEYPLDFFNGTSPVLTECLQRSNPKIILRFRSAPLQFYWIEYVVGYLHDTHIKTEMRSSIVNYHCQLSNGVCWAPKVITYYDGSITKII